ncbi:rod shape-determining protein MreD [Patescibacteria group bacterium]
MLKKSILLSLICYILVLLQTGFMPHFSFFGLTLNLILIIVILINFLEKPENKSGLMTAFFGGIFLDVFSTNFIGFYVVICLIIALFLKYVLRQYIKIPTLG